MIDERIIEQLLAAFYNGDTTPEEEEILSDFFNNQNSSGKFQADRELFKVLYDASRIPLPEGFSQRLEKKMDHHIAHSKISFIHNGGKRAFLKVLISVAAVVLLCIGLFFLHDKQERQHFIADTYSSPEEAAVAAEQALMLVSTKLNQGLLPLVKVKESVNITNRLLNENFYEN